MVNSPITPGQLEHLADMIAERLAKQPRCIDKCEPSEKLGVAIRVLTLTQVWVEEREAVVDFSD